MDSKQSSFFQVPEITDFNGFDPDTLKRRDALGSGLSSTVYGRSILPNVVTQIFKKQDSEVLLKHLPLKAYNAKGVIKVHGFATDNNQLMLFVDKADCSLLQFFKELQEQSQPRFSFKKEDYLSIAEVVALAHHDNICYNNLRSEKLLIVRREKKTDDEKCEPEPRPVLSVMLPERITGCSDESKQASPEEKKLQSWKDMSIKDRQKVECWQLGLMFVVLLSGRLLTPKLLKGLLKCIQDNKPADFFDEYTKFTKVELVVVQIIQGCLQSDPDKRMTAAECVALLEKVE